MSTTTSRASAVRAGRGGVTEQATDAAVDQACRMLRLPTMRTRFAEVADAAQREQLTYRGFLAELLMAECDDRDRRRSARRITAAGFPREKWLQDFDYAANPHIQPAVIAQPAACAWLVKGEPLCLIGDSGTGKSHLLIGLGAAAAMAGHRVKYVLAAKLVNELVEAADERVLSKTIARYGRVDLLCLDELGHMELDRRGAELLFQVLTEREETNSVAIASNESFSGWTKTFTDPRLCAAIVDSLTFGGNIIETGTTSNGSRTPARSGPVQPPALPAPELRRCAASRHPLRCVVGIGVVGKVLVGVVGMEQRLVQQLAHVHVGSGVEHERAVAAGLDQSGEPELGQVLADRGGRGPDQTGQARHRRLALQQRPQQLDPGGVGEHPEGLRGQVDLLLARHQEVRQLVMHTATIDT